MRYVACSSATLRPITLPCLVIHNVTVGSHSADFVHTDPIANLTISNAQDVHNHPELKRKLYSALQEGDEGELSIAIPKEVSLRQSGNRTVSGIISEGMSSLLLSRNQNQSVGLAATPEPQTPGHPVPHAAPVPEFTPILVSITYSIKNPADGIQFVLPSESYQTVSFQHSYVLFLFFTKSPLASAARFHHSVFTRHCTLLGALRGQPVGEVYMGFRIHSPSIVRTARFAV